LAAFSYSVGLTASGLVEEMFWLPYDAMRNI